MSPARLLAAGLGALLALSAARADDKPMQTGFLDRVHKDADGKEVRYVLFVPLAYSPKVDKPYPLILFLHGAGETLGGQKQPVEVGFGPAIKKQEKTFPFFAIIPQAQTRGWQADGPNAAMALSILDEVQKGFSIDANRLYLTGLSMGGFGTWSLAAKYPERFAAIAPICGGSRGDYPADKVKDVPCWCFHGGADNVVPPKLSRDIVKGIWAAGGHPNYTEYPGVGHNSWDRAYGTADLYDWFLGHQRKQKTK